MSPPTALLLLVLSKFLAEHVTAQFRLLTVVAPCWMEAPWIPTVLGMLADGPCCPIIRDLIMVALLGWLFKDLQLLHSQHKFSKNAGRIGLVGVL